MSRDELGESRKIYPEIMGMINSVRQNHALEHATITLLVKRIDGNIRLIGRAALTGFYLYGDVPTAAVEEAARDGLRLLQDGNEEMAISPLCGTNLVVTGVLTGISSYIAGRSQQGMGKLSSMIRASIIAALVAQPLGRIVQRHLTTSFDLDEIDVIKVIRIGEGMLTRHKVEVGRL